MLTVSTPDLLTERQAAEYLNVSAGTLSVWRCTKRYPLPYVRCGRSIRYRRSDLEQWLRSRTVCPVDTATL